MAKRIVPVLLISVLCLTSFFSCKKTQVSNADGTLNYFPIRLGKYVTYAVDSIIYSSPMGLEDTVGLKTETNTQLKYSITDTFRDNLGRLSYIMDVFARPYDGSDWKQVRVITLTPAPIAPLTLTPPPNTPTNCLLYTQDGAQIEKMVFPIVEGINWPGNQYVAVADSQFMFMKNWNYTYQNMRLSYNNGYVNFPNTVTVLEDNESVDYPVIDSAVYAYRTYAKEVYGYNIGMVYREFTHWIYHPYNAKNVQGYSVVMRAIDYN